MAKEFMTKFKQQEISLNREEDSDQLSVLQTQFVQSALTLYTQLYFKR